MKFNKDFEDDILAQCLKNEEFLRRASRICQAHHFCTKERSWLWKTIYSNWSQYRERTTGKIIVSRARSDFPEKEKRKPYLVLTRDILKRKPKNPKTILDELDQFVRFVNIQIAIEESATKLEKGKLDDAEKVITKHTRAVSRQRKYTHIRWIEEFKERQSQRKYEREHPDEFTTIPLGFPRVDKALSGGGRKGELALIMGTTGRGKSIFITNSVMNCVMRGYNAIYFAFEMPARQIAMRQDARWSGFRYSQFKEYDFKPSELRRIKRRLKKAQKAFGNKLHIVSMPVRSANIFDVRNAIDDIRLEYGFEADAIFLDSADHLKSLDNYGGNYRLQQAEVYWSTKELGEEAGYFVMSSTQAGKEWAKRIATAEATSESYDKGRIADLILSINDPLEFGKKGRKTIITEDEDEDDDFEKDEEIAEPAVMAGSRLMDLFMSKYRDGESRFKVPIICDYPRMSMSEVVEGDEDDD